MKYTFPGQYFDEETGLHYNWHRYYDPKIGRYLRADPSLSMSAVSHIPFRLLWELSTPQGLNYFSYTNNNPNKYFDITGLSIWVCNRKTNWGVGNHAYFWDDRNQKCCGMGSTKKCKEHGPGKDSCRKVGGSAGKEDQIMKCCKDTADGGMWAPPINDCHEALDDCLKSAGLKNPGAPGGRLGEPCDPCDKDGGGGW